MKKLSAQLSALSDRTKKTEDTVDAALEKDRTKLQAQRDTVKASAVAAVTAVKGEAAEVKMKIDDTVQAARTSLDVRFAAMKVHAEERRTEHDIKKADLHADIAEQDAVDAIDLALHVLDQAQSAITDAVLARADADDLALSV